MRTLLALVLAVALGAQDKPDKPRPRIPGNCERQLLDTSHKVPLELPGFGPDAPVTTSNWQHALYDDLLADFNKSAPEGTVLYSFLDVTIKAKKKSGVAAIRLERGGNETHSSLMSEPTMRPLDLSQHLELAMQPSAIQRRRELSEALFGTHNIDAGKVVLFRELDHYGVLPTTVNRASAIVVASNDVGRALSNYALLQQPLARGRLARALVAYPESEAEMKLVFGDDTKDHIGSVKEWAVSLGLVRAALQAQGVASLSIADMGKLGTKEKLEEYLQGADDIVVLLAHVAGCYMQFGLPGPQGINLKPGDIANLKLPKRPFVVMRACYGQERGFAEALLKAGARGVWVNRGSITPMEATSDVELFFQSIIRTNNFLQTIQELSGESNKLELPGARKTVKNAGLIVFLWHALEGHQENRNA